MSEGDSLLTHPVYKLGGKRNFAGFGLRSTPPYPHQALFRWRGSVAVNTVPHPLSALCKNLDNLKNSGTTTCIKTHLLQKFFKKF
jgi:hypothetical protein